MSIFRLLAPFILVISLAVGDRLNYTDQDEFYGKTWMYFPDGNGVPQVIFLTENTGRSFGRYDVNCDDYISYYLYTIKTGINPKKFHLQKRHDHNAKEFMSYFRKNVPTYIIVHGWSADTHSHMVADLRNNYLKDRDCNVIAVDWSELAANSMYPVPVRQTRDVGKNIAEFIDFMVEKGVADIDQIQLIGMSLGAHVVGYAGKFVKSGRIPRITGLDPARPGFEGKAGKDGSLDASDAKFVDVIHTCAGFLGYKEPIGHVDFYPNDGYSQPGCGGYAREMREMCSHKRSFQYYAESILMKKSFIAHKCQSYQEFKNGHCKDDHAIPMGDSTPTTAHGVYYLKTSRTPNYSLD